MVDLPVAPKRSTENTYTFMFVLRAGAFMLNSPVSAALNCYGSSIGLIYGNIMIAKPVFMKLFAEGEKLCTARRKKKDSLKIPAIRL
jgi:hypothetical protein